MPYLSEELSDVFSLCASQSSRRKLDANRFHKCRSSDERGDFSCFETDELDSLISRLQLAFESASEGLKKCSVQAANDRIFISLHKPNIFRHGLRQALSSGSQYGRNRLMEGNVISVAIDGAGFQDSPTHWRLSTTRDILEKSIIFSGGVISQDAAPFELVVSNKNRRRLENGATIFVGNVACRSDIPITMDDFRRAFSEQISQMSQVRLGEDNSPESNLHSLSNASVMFALLNGNLSKTVNVKLDSSIAQFCKGAVFVLYNFCRMTHVIFKYRKLEKCGSYPSLPDLDLVDFSLLSNSEEWDLMLNFIVDWPRIFESSVSGLTSGEFKLHTVLDFLKSLASKFSAYYRRTRILTESRPHLLPVLHARIYLVLGLMEVFRNALDLLGLQPVQNM